MGFYESAYWLSDAWGGKRRERMSGAYHPFVPDSLGDSEISHGPATLAEVIAAQTDIAVLNEKTRHLRDTEPLARLILRSEAMASSRIEGLEIPVGKILEYEALDELGVHHRLDATEVAVLANISAMQEGVDRLATADVISVEDICHVNRLLLENTRGEDAAGILRTQQNWIGGNNANPVGAAYVPPRPELVPALMDDLVRFINTASLPPVSMAAIAHAQFETIHPFADGNGRTGRALIHALLRRSGIAPNVIPPVSLVLATDRHRYVQALAAYRVDDASALVSHADAIDAWVAYFAHAMRDACERAAGFEDMLGEIEAGWRVAVHPRKGSAADVLLGKLIGNPVMSVNSAARLCDRSYEAMRKATAMLAEKGVLVQNAKNRKSNIYVAHDVIDAFTRFERSLATLGGDTREEKPLRPVPQRPKAPSLAASIKQLEEARQSNQI